MNSMADPVDEAFLTLFMPGILQCLTNEEVLVSCDAAIQDAATASCSVPFNAQGFIQAANQVRAAMLHQD
jgi:hypothetical protein